MNTPKETPSTPGRALARLLMRIRPCEIAEILKALFRLGRVVIPAGELRLSVDLASSFGSAVDRAGDYEPGLTREIEGLLREGDTFVDLGANEGWFSLIAARRVGPRGMVLAIEPQERLWPIIIANSILNRVNNIQLAPYALDDVPQLEFRHVRLAPSTNTGSTTLVGSVRSRLWTSQAIAIGSMDHVLQARGIVRAKLLKIDIEGFEIYALRSGKNTLRSKVFEHIIVETHPEHIGRLGLSVDEVDALLIGVGYKKRLLAKDSYHYTVLS
jgi:FkbM family methyltransferase